MEKDINEMMQQPQEPTVQYAYVIKHFSDGSITVDNADIEGVQTKLSANEMYSDIEDIAKTIELRRITDASYAGALKALSELINQQRNQ